jgi:hypothetical protein
MSSPEAGTPKEIRYKNKRKYTVNLYEDEIMILKHLIQGEIKELEQEKDKVKELRPYSQAKIIIALQELIDEYTELLNVLDAVTAS